MFVSSYNDEDPAFLQAAQTLFNLPDDVLSATLDSIDEYPLGYVSFRILGYFSMGLIGGLKKYGYIKPRNNPEYPNYSNYNNHNNHNHYPKAGNYWNYKNNPIYKYQ